MDKIIQKALLLEPLSEQEGLELFTSLPTEELLLLGDKLRYKHNPSKVVTWQIDRNVNITNVCISGCKFCNFHCKPHQKEKIFITSIEEYRKKIEETLRLGGDQLLLQGGLHPKLGIEFYEDLFSILKKEFPTIRLHALGPPEIYHISKISSLSYKETLVRLINSGLDSLPGAGAEILDNEVRKKISPGKCSADEWLEVMEEAHRLGLATSATMVYGHIETPKHIISHLIKLRDLQARKPIGSYGFLAFIPWVLCGKGTKMEKEWSSYDNSIQNYLRIIAISRIMLNNIKNIQASWLTLGEKCGELGLHCGANDLGSIMIEENVVASVGVRLSMSSDRMETLIKGAGFTSKIRNQLYQERSDII